MNRLHLIGVCFATMAVLDFVLEAVIYIPLGAYVYPGGDHLAELVHSKALQV